MYKPVHIERGVQRLADNYVIEMLHITKEFPGIIANDDITLQLRRGEIHALLGENGAGKSTLMKIITGVIQPDEGEVEIGDTIKIGYFAQEVTDMDGKQRVIDYIKDVAEYVPTKEGRITASQMLERFLFDGAMQYTPIEKLSGGEKRRLYLCKVLMESPNVLILDEPTNGLDPAGRKKIRDLLKNLCEEYGTTIMISSLSLIHI